MSVYYFFHWAKGPRRNDDLTTLCHGEVFFICVLFNLIHVVLDSLKTKLRVTIPYLFVRLIIV